MHGLHNGSKDSDMHVLHNGPNNSDIRGLHNESNDSDMHGLHNGSNDSDMHGLHNGSKDSDMHGLHNGSNDSDMHGLHNGSMDSDMHGLHNGSKDSDMHGLHNGSKDSDMHGLHNGSKDSDMHGLHNGSKDSDMHGLHNGSKDSDMHGLHNGSKDSDMHVLHNGPNDSDICGLHNESNDSDMHGLHNGLKDSDMHGLHNGSKDSDMHGLHNGSKDSDMHGLHNGSNDNDVHYLHNGLSLELYSNVAVPMTSTIYTVGAQPPTSGQPAEEIIGVLFCKGAPWATRKVTIVGPGIEVYLMPLSWVTRKVTIVGPVVEVYLMPLCWVTRKVIRVGPVVEFYTGINMNILLAALILGLASGQNIQVTFHMDLSEPDQEGGAKDLTLPFNLIRVLYSIFCYGGVGEKFVVRIDPNNAHMEIIDRSIRFDNRTKGIDSCMPASNAVQCARTHVCKGGNKCVVNLAIDCGQTYGPNRWERTPQVEATLQDIHGELVLRDCFVMCLDSGYVEEVSDSGQQGLSYVMIALIVTGLVFVAALSVVGCVVWKLRAIRRMEPATHHHIHYAS
ncbi:hypothetical protein Btru_051174 [Bulinus truncatus]|nr:hypothetical protein Btru_051174 [Bulinus truncatus]